MRYRFTHCAPYTYQGDGLRYFTVYVFWGEERVGEAGFRFTAKSLIPDDWTEVAHEHQRQGIATAMYRWAEELTGLRVRPSRRRSPEALAFWQGFGRRKAWRKPNFSLPRKRRRPLEP